MPLVTNPRRAPGVPRLYYGWILIGTLAITELISWGVLYYTFPVLLVLSLLGAAAILRVSAAPGRWRAMSRM